MYKVSSPQFQTGVLVTDFIHLFIFLKTFFYVSLESVSKLSLKIACFNSCSDFSFKYDNCLNTFWVYCTSSLCENVILFTCFLYNQYCFNDNFTNECTKCDWRSGEWHYIL